MSAERSSECREVRAANRSHLPKVLQEQFGPAVHHAGNVFPDAVVGVLRGHRLGAGHGVAAGGQLKLPQVSGLRPEGADAGSFDGVADAAFVFGGDAPGGDEVGAQDSAQAWAGRCAERVYRRGHVTGQRGDEESGAAGHRPDLRRLSTAVGGSRRHRESDQRAGGATGWEVQEEASNDDWINPHDPSARITKIKDGRTRLAYKAEYAVDLAAGALLAVTVQPADRGDTTSYVDTLDPAQCEAVQSHPIGIEGLSQRCRVDGSGRARDW